tara:strand:- start:197 stop:358 length:162 start_codon:yes stop_codon:yes gene_type:complete
MKKYNYSNENVVEDKIISSRGAGTAFDFSLKLIDRLVGKEKADEIAKAICYGR